MTTRNKGWMAKCPICDYKTKSFQHNALDIVHNKMHEHLEIEHQDTIIESFRNSICEFKEISKLLIGHNHGKES